MKKRILLFLCLIFSVLAVAFAQTKTVTNSDLEKFRQKRLEAEKDYRENYAKLGFPSPQELEAQLNEDKRELAELSERLREERLERERANALELRVDSLETQNDFLQYQNRTSQRYERNYFYGYTPYVYFNFPKRYRTNNNRRKRFRLGNQIPPIRPPKPIRNR